MDPHIAALDRALALKGEAVTLRRRIGESYGFVEVVCRARLSGHAATDQDDGRSFTAVNFVMSPSAITAAATAATWPGAAEGDAWPDLGDILLSQGRTRRITEIEMVTIGDVVVRINGKAEG